MKKLNRVITGILAAAMVCTSAACAGGNQGGNDSSKDDTVVRERYTYEGTHIMTAPEVENEYIVKNGETDYVMVVPASQDSYVKTAVDEFSLFFKKATDIELKVVRDDSNDPVLSNANAKRFSIGLTTLVNGMTKEEQKGVLGYDNVELGEDGVRIVTINKTVYLLGGTSYGVLYSVYDFLQICFNYEFYYRNCIQIDTGVRNLKLRAFDVTDIPDVAFRPRGNPISLFNDMWDFEYESGLMTQTDASRAQNRYRYAATSERYLPIFKDYQKTSARNYGYHSSADFAYPGCTDREGNVVWNNKWGGDDGVQLCYTAHGDDDALSDLIDLIVDKITYSLEIPAYSNRQYCGLTVMDGGSQCKCDSCTEACERDGGSWAGQVIRVCNSVMEKVQAWRAENGFDDQFNLYFFAYGSTDYPPVVEDANGNYVPANEEVICRDDVVTLLCISNWTTEMYWPDDAYAEKLLLVKKWGAVTSKMFNWLYQMRFLGYSTYVDSITQLNTDFYSYLLNYGTMFIVNQGDWHGESITSWGVLNEYVFSKLMWDTTLDTETLVKDFFRAMYKDAADTMYQIFEMQREHAATISQNPLVGMTVGSNADSIVNHPYTPYLLPLIELYEKALSEISGLEQTSPGEYILVRKRIENEYVAPLYLTLSLYGTQAVRPFNDATKQIYKDRLIDITEHVFFRISELGGNIYEFACGV